MDLISSGKLLRSGNLKNQIMILFFDHWRLNKEGICYVMDNIEM